MAVRKPLVMIGNKISEMPAGDIFSGLFGGALTVNHQVITADGDWTKPANAYFVVVRCIGCGGPGGGGEMRASGTAKMGGQGGGAGEVSFGYFLAAALDATVACIVGTGSSGAAGATSTGNGNTAGVPTGGALQTRFGTLVRARPGEPGGGGNAGDTTSAKALYWPNPHFAGIGSFPGSPNVTTPNSTGNPALNRTMPNAGGNGGYVGANTTHRAGGTGGRAAASGLTSGGTAAGAPGTPYNGANGADPGDGGGGGFSAGANTVNGGVGGNGGNGAAPGGGGGGGGSGTDGAGNGGSGARGQIDVWTFVIVAPAELSDLENLMAWEA